MRLALVVYRFNFLLQVIKKIGNILFRQIHCIIYQGLDITCANFKTSHLVEVRRYRDRSRGQWLRNTVQCANYTDNECCQSIRCYLTATPEIFWYIIPKNYTKIGITSFDIFIYVYVLISLKKKSNLIFSDDKLKLLIDL